MREELQSIVDEFADAPRSFRLELLLDFADGLPDVPPHLAGRPEAMEQVVECQTPFFVAVETDESGGVRLHFDAPPEAPTTRGYAGVLHAGLDGARPEEILETPSDFWTAMDLSELISPLRLRGMSAILARVKRRTAALAAAS